MEKAKKLAAEKAALYLKDGMTLGIGTGSTVFYFIEALIKRCREGLRIHAVSSSLRSMEQAKAGGIPFLDVQKIEKLDLTVDGADAIDLQGRMIKGGGGALLREKILAFSSKEMIVIIDESKLVPRLGRQKLPVEILSFGLSATIFHLKQLGFQGMLRKNQDGSLYLTDNNNPIYDIHYPSWIDHPEEDHLKLLSIPGVIETGFFFNLAKKTLVGYEKGHVEEISYHDL